MRFALPALLLAAACVTPKTAPVPAAIVSQAPAKWDDPARLEKLIAAANAQTPALDRRLAELKIPGGALGMVAGGKLVWFHATGVRNVSSGQPVDQDTVFRIASMSKAFVADAVLRLRDEGKLSLDDPAEKYLPELRRLVYPTADSPRITVRHLLSHSSGLPEDNATADLRMPMSDADFDKLLSHGLSFSSTPGTQYEYSNLGFALAGRLVTRVSGMRLQEYVTRNLLIPLGMTSTRWDADAVPEEHKAHGYGRKGSAMPSSGLARYEDDVPHEEPVLADGSWAPIGGLWTTPRDYAKWIAFQLSAWPPRDDADQGPLRRASLREAQSLQRSLPVVAARDEHDELDVAARGYGLGWGVRSTCGFENIVTHSGGLPGYGSYVLLLPAQGVGFFSMTNLTYTSGAVAVNELIKNLREKSLLPARPTAISEQLDRARAGVLELLSGWDSKRATSLFDEHYASYRSPEQQRAQLEALSAVHGRCHPDIIVDPENALRGRMQLDCDNGDIAMSVELTSDAPARIQSLVLESILPPSTQLQQAAARAMALYVHWSTFSASQVFAPEADTKKVQHAFDLANANQGACKLGEPLRGDGKTKATFRLSCENGDAELSLRISSNKGVVDLDVTPARGGPRCPK
jgi:CubicO group peptidase (beta-lactamase class C family)